MTHERRQSVPVVRHSSTHLERTHPAVVDRRGRTTGGNGRLAWRIGSWLLCVGSLGLVTGTGRAEINRSVDESGVIQFSNRSTAKSGKRSRKANSLAPVLPHANAGRNASRFDAHIREAARLYRLPEGLIRAVIKVESNFDPRAVSHANAHGLMQLIPATAARMMVTDIYDPRQNILGGARYLRVLANTFNGNLHLTLAAYNAGEGAVARYGGIPPYAETQAYVAKVTQYYQQYR